MKFSTKADERKFWTDWPRNNHNCDFDKHSLDWPQLCALLARHPSHPSVSPDRFAVRSNRWSQPELRFYIGEKFFIFSVQSCLSGKIRDQKQSLNMAMRESVRNQIEYFLLQTSIFNSCDICGTPLAVPVHVDHVIPFKDLTENFLKASGLTPPTDFIEEKHIGGKLNFHPRDAHFSDAWQRYHQEFALLRMVHAKCNLTRK